MNCIVDNSMQLTKMIAWLLCQKQAHIILKIQIGFVMNVFEERLKAISITARKNDQLLVVKPPKSLFKVVVNNYKQQERFWDKYEEEIGETMTDQGLPPQPSGYLKFPEHDWF